MRGEAVDRADTVVQAVRLLELVILNQGGSWSRHDSWKNILNDIGSFVGAASAAAWN